MGKGKMPRLARRMLTLLATSEGWGTMKTPPVRPDRGSRNGEGCETRTQARIGNLGKCWFFPATPILAASPSRPRREPVHVAEVKASGAAHEPANRRRRSRSLS